MERQTFQLVPTLVSTQTLLLEVTEFLTSYARRGQEDTKHVDSISVFHTRLHADLLSIKDLWRRRRDRPLTDDEEDAGIALLTTVENHFITGGQYIQQDYDGSDGGQEDTLRFPRLYQVLNEAATKTCGRINWLLARLNLESPKPRLRRRLVRNSLSYLKAIERQEECYDYKNIRRITEWKDAGTLFKKMHKTLQDQWRDDMKHTKHVKLPIRTRFHTAVQSKVQTKAVFADNTAAPIPLVDTMGSLQLNQLLDLGLKDRLRTALVLAYAYLHLGGGPLWPYHAVLSHLGISDIERNTGVAATSLFFSTDTDSSSEEGTRLPRMLNPSMPSLSVLAITFLSLASGRIVSWRNYRAEIQAYEHSDLLSPYITTAVRACLEDSAFKDDSQSIMTSERVRMTFVENVIMNLQFVLEIGFQITFDQVFETRGPFDAGDSPNTSTFSSSVRASVRTYASRRVDRPSHFTPHPDDVQQSRQRSTPSLRGHHWSNRAAYKQSSKKTTTRDRTLSSNSTSWSQETEKHISSHTFTGNHYEGSARVVNGNTIVHGNYHYHYHEHITTYVVAPSAEAEPLSHRLDLTKYPNHETTHAYKTGTNYPRRMACKVPRSFGQRHTVLGRYQHSNDPDSSSRMSEFAFEALSAKKAYYRMLNQGKSSDQAIAEIAQVIRQHRGIESFEYAVATAKRRLRQPPDSIPGI